MNLLRKLLFITLSILNWIIPKDKKRIAIYGRSAINENNLALLEHLIHNYYKYDVRVIIVKNIKLPQRYKANNVKVITNPLYSVYNLLRSNWIFHTYGLYLTSMKPAHCQIIFNLWHGSPLKRIGLLDVTKPFTYNIKGDSYYLSASDFWTPINKKCWGYSDTQFFVGGNPRNDLLFKQNKVLDKLTHERFIVLFMPTFRSSRSLGKYESDNDIPLLRPDNIEIFDKRLSLMNVLFIIKPHPAQDKIDFIEGHNFSNIRVIRNEWLGKHDISLYELIGYSKALISDFSSVIFDYFILNRPIAYAIDDIDSYTNNRGFTIENPFDLMPGDKLVEIGDLLQFISDVANNVDNYREQRKRVTKLTNKVTTPTACAHILNFVGIKNE